MAYLFNTSQDIQQMLAAIGVTSIDELFDTIPKELWLARDLAIPAAMSELELTGHMSELASRNKGLERDLCFLGAGAYDHFIPAVVDHLSSRGEFYTSYTPYQPEVSQGNLQVMFEYETLICQLTGMDVSNASLYDGASATLEAVLLAMSSQRGRTKVLVPNSLHPEYRQVLKSYLQWTNFELLEIPCPDGTLDLEAWRMQLDSSVGCVVLSQPNFFGLVDDLSPISALAKQSDCVVIGVVDMISLGVLASPADWNVDIVVGEGQPLGNPLQYGGPYLGILACREQFVRRVPGRIAGQTVDRNGDRCWVLTLQTREQHIRREKATSNICTNQGLFALRAAIYLALQGPDGLRETAEHCTAKVHYVANQLANSERFKVRFQSPFWREVVIQDLADDVAGLLAYARSQGVQAGVPLSNWYDELSDCFMIAVTEKRTRQELERLVKLLTLAPRRSELSHA
ncbi:MAG: aminomethyl-transferring glycine dehydrogenase subunit GcvPA [Planctomycetales bacterium]|nr:aminomethyl-transferring glycine dehydrogenase subunit GcvPA [Planctomycetales bacterium]